VPLRVPHAADKLYQLSRESCRGWRNQTEVTVTGSHFIQEDSGLEIGRAIAEWAATLPRRVG